MSNRISLLDHGYLELVETWGSDERIVEAARMSTGKGFLGWGPLVENCDNCSGAPKIHEHEKGYACPQCRGTGKKQGDEKLLRYLWEHKHATPFEMAGMVIEVYDPTCVVWEWVRHRTQSYNIQSSRYGPIPNIDYVPTPERCLLNGGTKQGSAMKGAKQLTGDSAERWLGELRDLYDHSQRVYQSGLDVGVPMELARLSLTFGRYWRMRASANLRNWLAFLMLRMAPEAQWEIRQYANAVGSLIAEAFPRTRQLFRGDE